MCSENQVNQRGLILIRLYSKVHFLLPVFDFACHMTSSFPFCVCLCFCLLVLKYSILQILSVMGSCLEQDSSQQLELIIVFFLRSFGNVRLPASPKVCYFFWNQHVPSPILLESIFILYCLYFYILYYGNIRIKQNF